jgi:hypothetical protein
MARTPRSDPTHAVLRRLAGELDELLRIVADASAPSRT